MTRRSAWLTVAAFRSSRCRLTSTPTDSSGPFRRFKDDAGGEGSRPQARGAPPAGEAHRRASLTEAIAERLVDAQSFDQANRLGILLADEPSYVDGVQMRRLRKAQKENGQVEDAWHVELALARVEQKVGIGTAKSSATEISPRATSRRSPSLGSRRPD